MATTLTSAPSSPSAALWPRRSGWPDRSLYPPGLPELSLALVPPLGQSGRANGGGFSGGSPSRAADGETGWTLAALHTATASLAGPGTALARPRSTTLSSPMPHRPASLRPAPAGWHGPKLRDPAGGSRLRTGQPLSRDEIPTSDRDDTEGDSESAPVQFPGELADHHDPVGQPLLVDLAVQLAPRSSPRCSRRTRPMAKHEPIPPGHVLNCRMPRPGGRSGPMTARSRASRRP
jgi:hypothetical protein